MLRSARRAHDAGNLAAAERLYGAILQLDRSHVDALHLCGMLNYQRGRLEAALSLIRSALAVDPRRPEILSDLGLVLYAAGRLSEALASYEAALAIDPDNPDALNGRGVSLMHSGRITEALACFERSIALDPSQVDAYGNRGNALLRLNRPEEAIASYADGLKIAPNHARLLTNQAAALCRLDRLSEALRCVRPALVGAPDFAEARFVESLIKLTLGDFKAGWAAYESRWGSAAFAAHRRSFAVPLWLGDRPSAGKTILLHAEQGYGDTVHFVRYAPLVAGRGATVVLEAQPELVRLLSSMRGIAAVVARGEPLPEFDLHCPLMSLPLALGMERPAVPLDLAYLTAPEQNVARWRARLPAARFRVGLVWAGDKGHKNDVNRSVRLELLRPLLDLPQVQFVSLQQEVSAEDAQSIERCPNLFRSGTPFRDFADTAGLISQLDAVIAVDTAVAHLAGAMAKPLFLLLPFAADFRWLRGRGDTPWYPTARLIRQHRFNDWGCAIDELVSGISAVRGGRRESGIGRNQNGQE